MKWSDLIEECDLNLFGKLLSDRQQNQRALKSTLRATWKTGSDLRIVDVGNNIYQFKFSSEYQLEWVEKMVIGTLTITCYFFAGGERGSQSQISFSLTLHFGFKFGAFLLKTYLRM